MFFKKNLPMPERVMRAIVGLAIVILPFLLNIEPAWLKWLLVISGVSFICMGYIGYCPLCAAAGRKPVDS